MGMQSPVWHPGTLPDTGLSSLQDYVDKKY